MGSRQNSGTLTRGEHVEVLLRWFPSLASEISPHAAAHDALSTTWGGLGAPVRQSGARRTRLSIATTRLVAAASAKIRSQTLASMGAVWNASFITGK